MNTKQSDESAFKTLKSIYDAKDISGPYDDESREQILSAFYKATKVGIKGVLTVTDLADGSKILTENLSNGFPGSDIVEITYAPSYSYSNVKFLMNKHSLTNIHDVLKSLPRGNFSEMVSF